MLYRLFCRNLMSFIAQDLEVKNLTTFNHLAKDARTIISEALEIDESKANTNVSKENLISKYKVAVRKINNALNVKTVNCPPSSRLDINKTKKQLEKYLLLIKERILNLEKSNTTAGTSKIVISSKTLNKEQLLKNVNKVFGEEILMSILSDTKVKLSHIEGNQDAKNALEESVIFPALNPRLFTGLRAPCKGILLYGPPGNGKTMLAKAVADEANCTFFNISASTIMSKWVGEGEKMVKTLFQIARNAQPSIIFIDEVDSMLCERSENENGAQRRVKTEFLLQLDGCASTNEERILVLAATNRPQDLDDAVLRRFSKRIFIDLPDKNARANIIVRTFKSNNTQFLITKKELDKIATDTENYSFSDLHAICRAAAMYPVQSLGREKLQNVNEKNLRPVNYNDLCTALKNVRPSISLEKRQKLKEFAGYVQNN